MNGLSASGDNFAACFMHGPGCLLDVCKKIGILIPSPVY